MLYLLTILFSFSLFAAPILSSKRAPTSEDESFYCKDLVIEGCAYKRCVGKVSSYPLKYLVYIPSQFERVAVHFHGHILGAYPQYETSLSSMVSALGIEASICKGKEVMVFPKSVGTCTTYDQNFLSSKNFDLFMNQVFEKLNIPDMNILPLTLSAHSGGGRALAKILKGTMQKALGKASERINIAIFYDALYNDWQPNVIINWVNQNKLSKLQLVALSPEAFSPYRFSKNIFTALAINQKIESKEEIVFSKNFSHQSVSNEIKQIEFYSRKVIGNHTLNHYQIMADTWQVTHK